MKKEIKIMKKLFRWFIKGFLALLPILVTITIFLKILGGFEMVFSKPLRKIFGESYLPDPGMGAIVGIVMLIMFGYFLEKWKFVRRLYSLFCTLLETIPGVKSIYGAIKNIVQFFDTSKKEDFNRVVKITYENGTSELGLVTKESLDGLPKGVADPEKEEVIVFIPWSLQMGGRTVLVPKKMITPIPDMTPNQALKGIFTAFTAFVSHEKVNE